MMIQPKYQRLVLIEKPLRLPTFLALALIIGSILLNDGGKAARKTLQAVKTEKELAMNIPIMEKLIAAKTHVEPVRPIMVAEGPLELQGTYVQEGIAYALLNGTVLAVGDTYGDYEIIKVEFGTTILRHKKTNEQKILQFFYYGP